MIWEQYVNSLLEVQAVVSERIQVPLTDLGSVIVSEIRAAQEQALQAKYHATKVLQTETQSKVWLSQEITTQYNTSYQMPGSKKELYIRRNDIVGHYYSLT